MNQTLTEPNNKGGAERRSYARLMAVQAFYSKGTGEAADMQNESMIRFLLQHAHGLKDGQTLPKVDKKYYKELISGLEGKQREVDEVMAGLMDKSRTPSDLVYAILKVAIYEILAMKDVPEKIIITEYVQIARGFFDDQEAGFINAILDKAAKKYR